MLCFYFAVSTNLSDSTLLPDPDTMVRRLLHSLMLAQCGNVDRYKDVVFPVIRVVVFNVRELILLKCFVEADFVWALEMPNACLCWLAGERDHALLFPPSSPRLALTSSNHVKSNGRLPWTSMYLAKIVLSSCYLI